MVDLRTFRHTAPDPARPQEPHRMTRTRGPLRALIPALVVAAIVAACGGATPPPQATQAAAPADPVCPSEGNTCVGPLTPGPHTSISFQPQLRYTVPAGWRNDADRTSSYELRPAGFQNGGLFLFTNVAIASQDEACTRVPATDIGRSADEFVAWIAERDGLSTTRPLPVSVGGLDGLMIEVALAADWTFSCPFAQGIPSMPLFTSLDPNGVYWAIAGSERLRLYVLRGPEGIVLIDIDAFIGADFADLLAQATPVVQSFEFR
jgi:hypothetical protein